MQTEFYLVRKNSNCHAGTLEWFLIEYTVKPNPKKELDLTDYKQHREVTRTQAYANTMIYNIALSCNP